MFNPKTLTKLEFDKVINKLRGCCASALGVEKALALAPVTRLDEVVENQAKTTEAREILRREPSPPLEGIFDIRAHLWKAQKGGVIEPEGLLQIAFTLRASRKLKKLLQEGDPKDGGKSSGRKKSESGQPSVKVKAGPLLTSLAEGLLSFPQLEQQITNSIDETGEIKDSASPELRKVRRQINQMQLSIKEKLEQIVRQSDYQKYLQDPIITIRRDRYVVPVKREYQQNFSGIVHDQSSSGATVFMEPMAVVRINNELRRLEAEEEKEIERILRQITSMVSIQVDQIALTVEVLAEIDFCFAKGRLSLLMNGGEPRLSPEGELNLIQARHPLIPGRVIPVSISLGREFDILVITGPNTGGKTVTLKTVGLLCLMGQAGLHLPAETGTVIPIFNRICVDLGDEQSIEQSLSTFSSHMTNIIDILNRADRDSLVLLDELGAGTDPAEGAALGMAIVEHLLQRGVKAIATTHYSELKVFAYNYPRVENASVEFNTETLQPTYRLRIGLPGRSNAFEIATRLGMGLGIVERARTFLSREELQVADLLQNLKESHLKSEEERLQMERMSRSAKTIEDDLRRKQQEWKEKESRMLQQAQEEALEIVRRARSEADGIIKQLRQKSKTDLNTKEIAKETSDARERLGQLQDDYYTGWRGVSPSLQPKVDYKPGEAVLIPRLNQKGHVLSEPSAAGEVQVQVGVLRLTLSTSDLVIDPSVVKVTGYSPTQLGKLMADKTREISREVHLRGMLVDEALQDLEKYLDDAYIAGISPIYVIHGKGTGTLRAAVRRYLSEHPHVQGFRPADAYEGGMGVTVVEMKP